MTRESLRPLVASGRTVAVEIWGRGTNRVVEDCRRYGVAPPSFEEREGTFYVTFRAPMGLGAACRP